MVALNKDKINFGNGNIKILYDKIKELHIDKESLKCMKQMLIDNNVCCNERVMQYLLSERCDILCEYDKFLCILRIIVDVSLLTYE